MEVVLKGSQNSIQINTQNLSNHAHVYHIGDKILQRGGHLDRFDQLLDRHRIIRQIIPR